MLKFQSVYLQVFVPHLLGVPLSWLHNLCSLVFICKWKIVGFTSKIIVKKYMVHSIAFLNCCNNLQADSFCFFFFNTAVFLKHDLVFIVLKLVTGLPNSCKVVQTLQFSLQDPPDLRAVCLLFAQPQVTCVWIFLNLPRCWYAILT